MNKSKKTLTPQIVYCRNSQIPGVRATKLILRWLLDFWKICGPSVYCIIAFVHLFLALKTGLISTIFENGTL